MLAVITQWLSDNGISDVNLTLSVTFVGSICIFFLCAVSYYLAKHQVLRLVQKVVIHSNNTWDDLFFEHDVFQRIALMLPYIVLLFLVPIFTLEDTLYRQFLLTIAKIAICFQVARAISSLLNVIKSIYERKASERYLPLNSTLQVIKLLVYLVATILSISYILDRSPFYLLSGIGALTAVLLLVFQDTIKGLVASIQISANKMVAPGDWIEIPQYGADGDVLEIGLSTVKVQNFDRTVTTVPTYALISGSFKNWRDMFNSGGRRIKRALHIDISSIDFYNKEQLEELKKIRLLAPYLKEKTLQLENHAEKFNLEDTDVNSRQLTNIGTFRAYIEAYLKQHEKVHKNMTCMVRQLPSTAAGLPLELYFFSNDQNWVNYENIQADIFDHLFAMAKVFNIRLFQHPSGKDWQTFRQS
ncbi:mechanosensitive ion channel family protein [Thalassotalea profundi]|uniref:Small conductance mechanosensitive ion channel protein YbdG n=1 Tax=Thalassotalea profundi TaxID=2036687 RepID=A0ABQ3IQK6_9GAMM|nr:mechanosensitive ion channel domain-containing protein [Thalassotalea profundi]GHE88716.1 small conductance mechanosensitive ion channel protein YbdG [Thalassotalea profundi]